ncbi:MAG: ADP-ribosylglycohydrolase family protein [bacterium]|nr:ADP-ribosylglycohydrolase family protein [bacterium]MDE0602216.1 ADP-ribosylglycohydrolase family protein [bacterium]
MDLRDRIAGGLLGVAAGDALGATLEFMSPAQIKRRHGVHREITGGGPFCWRPGQGTDDTDLTWAVLAAYLDGPFTLERAAANMLDWYRSGPPDIGGATSEALGRLQATGDPRTSGATRESSCGNGSLMRCIPTALARADPGVRRRELAEVSAITHAHLQCTDSCRAYGEIVNALLEGAAAHDALAAARALRLHPKVREALDIDPRLPVDRLRTSGYVIHSLGCAVWAIQQDTGFEEVIVALVNRGDDADTTGAIAGGLVGVLWGLEAVPSRWRRKLEYRDRLMAAVPRLLALRG